MNLICSLLGKNIPKFLSLNIKIYNQSSLKKYFIIFFSDFNTNKKPNPEKKEEFSEFMIEKSGDENLLKRKVDEVENVKEKKKKKKIAKS